MFVAVSEPHSDPDQVQRVCEAVLEARFPLTVEQLKQKLKELQDLTSSLPDSSSVLTASGPQLESARRLLDAARDTRYTNSDYSVATEFLLIILFRILSFWLM